MFFLWPLLILAASVIVFGIFMARGALRAMNATLPLSNRFRQYTRLHEALFWIAVAVSGYGLYLVLNRDLNCNQMLVCVIVNVRIALTFA